jgi:Family of unknown function (DUF5675)
MKIIVNRFTSDSQSTISKILVDDIFICFGLEDEYRKIKITGETRITSGVYKIELQLTGDKHKKYKEQFGDIHKGMLHVMNVPNFLGILIHIGNTEIDTEGCLLVGTGAITEPGNISISNSRVAYLKLYKLVGSSAASGSLEIEYIDNDDV